MPFWEKVQHVADGQYAISRFVRTYQNKLRYFGDLRNQIVHGFTIEKKHYVVASDYAVEQIRAVFEEMSKPKSIGDIFTRSVYTCRLSDPLKSVIASMRDNLNTHVPVYDELEQFVEMLSESTIAYRLADQMNANGTAHIEHAIVGDVPLENTNDFFVFQPAATSIYEVEELFAKNFEEKKRLWAVFITPSGIVDEPIEWIITAMDLPRLADSSIL